MHTLKIYCAGGDVFLPEQKRQAVFDTMKQQAAALSEGRLKVELLIPIDNEIALEPAANAAAKRRNALAIRRANEAMIRSCDAVIANLSPFRGHEPDCGTAYECGYAAALGKTVLVYTDNAADQTDKYRSFDFNQSASDGRFAYTEIEDFALPFNLMMYDDAAPIFDSFAAALNYLATTWQA